MRSGIIFLSGRVGYNQSIHDKLGESTQTFWEDMLNTPALPVLRAMGLPELLDQAIRLYRQNFVKFVGIIAIPYIPLILIQGVLSYFTTGALRQPMNPFLMASSVGTMIVSFAQFLLIQGVATAALTRAVADVYTGKSADIIGSYKNLKGSWGRLVFALLFMSLVFLAAVIWFILPCIGWISGIGLLIFLAMAVLPMIAPVVVLEQRSVLASIRRAWDLTRMRFWWLIGFGFVINLFGQLVVTGPVLIIDAGLQAVLTSSNVPLDQQLIWSTVIQTLVGMVTNLFYLPLQLTAITVAYIDLRVRFEGLDLILQAAEPLGSASLDTVFLPQTAETAWAPFITGKDFGYFILLTIAGVVIYFLFGSILFVPMALALSTMGP